MRPVLRTIYRRAALHYYVCARARCKTTAHLLRKGCFRESHSYAPVMWVSRPQALLCARGIRIRAKAFKGHRAQQFLARGEILGTRLSMRKNSHNREHF